MTAPDPRLNEIQARLDAVTEWRRHFHAPHNLVDYSQRDVPYLLAELRKAHEALAAVEVLAESWRYKGEFGLGAWQEGYGPDMEGTILDNASGALRAAVAAAKGDERG